MPGTLKKILLVGLAYPAFFLASVVLGAYWTFPYDHLRDYLVEQAERDGSMQLEIRSVRPSWLTGVELEGVRLVMRGEGTRPPAELVVDRAEARVSLLALLTGTTEVSFDVRLQGSGRLHGSVADGSDRLRIVAQIEDLDLARLGPLQEAASLPIAGRLQGDIDLTIAQEAANTEGHVDLTLRNVSVGDGETPLALEGLGSGGLTLAQMNVGTIQLRLEAARGVGTIRRLRGAGEHADLWGSGNLRLVQPLRSSSLDLLVRIKFKDAYRASSDRMRALFGLLEMNPQVQPARTSDGALQWRIQGAFGSRLRMTPSGRADMPGLDGDAAAGE